MTSQPAILILFDWNNTLLNDAGIMHQAATKVFRAADKEPPPLKDFLQELAENQGDYLPIYQSRGVNLTPERMWEIFQMSYYLHIDEVELAPGAADALAAITALKMPMGIITAQEQTLLDPVMRKFNLWQFFENKIFIGIKDKTETIACLARREFIPPSRCVYIGDMSYDICQTKKAGAISIAYLNGLVPEDLVLAEGPHYVIRHFSELPPLVEKMME